MKILVGYVLGLALAFAASLIGQDIFLFAEVRDRIDRAIVDLTPSEAAPNAATRAAFELDDPNLYWQEAFDQYRYESVSRDWKHFHTNKILATPVWMLQVWLWYDRRSLEALKLRSACCASVSARGADGVAVAAYGRGLNDLLPAELDCVARLARFGSGSRRRLCEAVVRLLPPERAPSPP